MLELMMIYMYLRKWQGLLTLLTAEASPAGWTRAAASQWMAGRTTWTLRAHLGTVLTVKPAGTSY